MSDRRLDGRVAVVTGAGQGMGEAAALELAAAGARVAVNDLNAEHALSLSRAIVQQGGEAIAVPGDVASAGDVRQVFERVLSTYGTVDILVNNAGVLRTSRLEDIGEAEWDFVVEVNLKGVFLCAQAAARIMRPRRSGRIINVASMAGKATSTLGGAHYTAAKAGVLGLSRHLARELAPDLINVNAVCPGIVDTPMVRENTSPERLEAVLRSIPFGRLAKPEEVGRLIVFLASDDASYITGAAIDIHGGELIIQ